VLLSKKQLSNKKRGGGNRWGDEPTSNNKVAGCIPVPWFLGGSLNNSNNNYGRGFELNEPNGSNGGFSGGNGGFVSFEADDDPDNMVSIVSETTPDEEDSFQHPQSQLLYAKGLEERYKLAREPLRVCDTCHDILTPVQDELRMTNSNAVRFNTVDPAGLKRLFNSPLAFTLGHEVRKAAYTLNNLLPLPRRIGMMDDTPDIMKPVQDLKDTCSAFSPNLSDLDGVRIPGRLIEQARGIAVMTVVKGGFGIAAEFGTGLVVSRLDGCYGPQAWSAPCAIGMGGVSWGALVGAQVSDHVFLLMTDAAVRLLSSKDGSLNLGADVGVALGPLGRTVEGTVGVAGGAVAPIYTYSLSKGFYAGISFDGKMIVTRHKVNEKFYGYEVDPNDLLSGEVPIPPAAQPLYDALKRCHVYASRTPTAAAISPARNGLKHHQLPTAALQLPEDDQNTMISEITDDPFFKYSNGNGSVGNHHDTELASNPLNDHHQQQQHATHVRMPDQHNF